MGDVFLEDFVVGRLRPVPLVLVRHRDQDLVEQRVREARDLYPRARVYVMVRRGLRDPYLLAAGCRPDADVRAGIVWLRFVMTSLTEIGDRHLQGDAVHVDPIEPVDAGLVAG